MLWNCYSLFFFSFLCLKGLSYNKKEIKNSLRVVGGRLAAKDEFPYIVRIDIHFNEDEDQSFDSYISMCTGSALTPSWTMTAAHCVLENIHLEVYVRFNHFLPNIRGEIAKVLNSYQHPQFNDQPEYMRYDIGMLQTETVKISRYPKLSALDFTSLIGQKAVSVGHGITNITKGPIPLQVLKGMLSKCNYNRKAGGYIHTGLCIQAPCGVQAVLTGGDSGGPVIHSSGIVAVNSLTGTIYQEEEERLEPLFIKPTAGIVACVSSVLDWIVNQITNHTKVKKLLIG